MFANEIMIDKSRKKDHNLRYKLEHWKKMCTFDILNNISEYITLVQLIDSFGNKNHAGSVFGKWISDSNNEKALPLDIDSLNLFCACSDEYYFFAKFQVVDYAVKYFNPKVT